MMEMASKDIERLGGTVELVDIGKQKVRMCKSVPVNGWICCLPVHVYLIGYVLFFHSFPCKTTVFAHLVHVLI